MATQTEPKPEAVAAALPSRGENLALIFQELLTVIVRLRSDRQEVAGAEVFRSQVLHAIRIADQNARARGYTEDDIRLAVFAVVAFLDETILNLRKPIFKDWVRKPLQEELFGRHVAGEIFFQNLEQLLGRRDSVELADLIEVYYLALLLGYLGKYSISSRGDLHALLGQAEDKIKRIRKMGPEISPHWSLPGGEGKVARADPWIRRLGYTATGAAGVTLLLFLIYDLWLSGGVSALRDLAK